MTYPLMFKESWIALALALLPVVGFAQVKVGDNPDVIESSAELEIESTSKGFLPPRMTEAQMNAIVSPAEGLMVFCTDCMPKGVKIYNGTDWGGSSGAETDVSTNGTAAVLTFGGSGCVGSGEIIGTMVQGVSISGVELSFYADVIQPGTWSLTTIQNGVTFSGSGTFIATGCQQIILTGSGTPAASGTFTWTTNTAPAGSATATVMSDGTGGTGVVNGYGLPACSGPTFSGTLTQGVEATGSTVTIYADVAQAGTYDISATENGVTFSGSGTFAGTGCQPIVLTGSGTPAASGTFTWLTNTQPEEEINLEVGDLSTGGTGVVSTYGGEGCVGSGEINGTMMQGVSANSSTMVLYADVTRVGTYNISAVENGVAFSGSGAFSSTGCQTIVLAGSGSPVAVGSYTWTTNTIPAGSATSSVGASIPPTIELGQNQEYSVASIFDQDYIPYTAPSGPATFNQVSANGVNEPVTVDVQGSITTSGVSIRIPVSATGNGTLPPFSSTIVVPAEYTEDGTSRSLMLSWASQSYSSTTKFINANLRAVDGVLNVKKLDINGGIGIDNKGVAIGAFIYPYDDAGNTTTFEVRAIAGVPDRRFGNGTHDFIYIPVTTYNYRTWLNNNLGAENANVNSPSFNPAASGVNHGSYFQWGRYSDGHEFKTSSTTTSLSNTDQPSHSSFILNSNTPNDWRAGNNNNRWNATPIVNNPCPVGYRLATEAEWNLEIDTWSVRNSSGAATSKLKLSRAGSRNTTNNNIRDIHSQMFYWTSTVSGSYSVQVFANSGVNVGPTSRGDGKPVRCILDYISCPLPSQPSMINGNSSGPCPGSSQTYSINGISGETYDWSVPSGWTINSGQGSNSITVTVGNSDGTISVTPSNLCGAGTARTLAITGVSPPGHPGAIAGPSSPAAFSTQTYTCGPVSGVTYYEWSVPAAWSIISGQGTLSITVKVGENNGEVRVSSINACGVTTGGGHPTTRAVTVPCNYISTAVVPITSPTTGRVWMDRNLGAQQVATAFDDELAYGYLFQWGRGADGHQCRTSPITNIVSNTVTPGHGDYISTGLNDGDWISPQMFNLWQGVDGINNPCPPGYRLPTVSELGAELAGYESNRDGAFASPLKLTAAGERSDMRSVGNSGMYATSTVPHGSFQRLVIYFNENSAYSRLTRRGNGTSVRCIQD